jgi:cell division septation protein DedD
MDSAFARARQLVISGQTAAGRQIADSILAATPVTSPAYGNALFGRAQLAPTAADAERDYQRIIVEYPLSTHAGDALLQLAQIERSRGDRAAAVGHLRRYLQENPGNAKRARTGFWLAQLLFEQNDDTAACPVLHDAQLAVDPGNVELQNQMNFYATRCRVAEARAAADSLARADSIRADSAAQAEARKKSSARSHAKTPARPATPTTKSPSTARTPPATDATGGYAVQVGAYGAKADAQQAADRLHARGIEARVNGTAKPFRVWIGHYKTKAAAATALAEFKKLGIDGFVASTGGR